ncbi:MAG: class I tRNA ligase family protein, partial [Thermoplasmata archaeon]
MSIELQDYDPKELEKKIQEYWSNSRLSDRVHSISKGGKKRYMVHTPHQLGKKMDVSIMFKELIYDVMTRFHLILGDDVRNISGFNMFSLSLENTVSKASDIKFDRHLPSSEMQNFFMNCHNAAEEILRNTNEFLEPLSLLEDDSYLTSQRDYIDSAWWTAYQLLKLDLLEKDIKTLPWCAHCDSTLTEMELGTETVEVEYNLIKLPLSKGKNRYFLVNLPELWHLMGCAALGVNPKKEYSVVAVRIDKGIEKYLLRRDKVEHIMSIIDIDEYKITNTVLGKKLDGIAYVNPLMDYIPYIYEQRKDTKIILSQDIPKTSTGIFNITPGIDLNTDKIASEYKLPIRSPLDTDGRIRDEKSFGDFGGVSLEKAQKKILSILKGKDLHLVSEKDTKTTDICVHCGQDIIHHRSDEWFFITRYIEDEMQQSWDMLKVIPPWMGGSKHHDWIENKSDLPVTRNGGWGIPFPVWTCECGNRFVAKSVNDLSKTSGEIIGQRDRLTVINQLTIPCDQCGENMHKEPKVFNPIFLSSISPWAQFGYLGGKTELDSWTPGDYLYTSIDEQNGVFYGIHSASSCLFEDPIVSTYVGHGKVDLQSSSSTRIPSKFGADSFRLELLSDRPIWDDVEISLDMFTSPTPLIRVLWNLFEFTKNSIHDLSFEPGYATLDVLKNHLKIEDRWILSQIETLKMGCKDNYLDSRFDRVLSEVNQFIMYDLAQFYFGLARKRLEGQDEKGTIVVLKVLNDALMAVSKILFPICPHICEEIYLNLGGSKKSVLLSEWPDSIRALIDSKISDQIEDIKNFAEEIYRIKRENDMPEKWPLKRIVIDTNDPSTEKIIENYGHIIKDRCRIESIEIVPPGEEWDEMILKVHPNRDAIGRSYRQWVRRIALMLKKRPAKEIKKGLDAGVAKTQIDLVEIIARAAVHDLFPADSEMQQDGLLDPGIDAPARFAGLGHAQVPPFESRQ